MVYIYSLVAEKPNLTSLNCFLVGGRGSGVNLCRELFCAINLAFDLLLQIYHYIIITPSSTRTWGVIHVCVIDFPHSISEMFAYNPVDLQKIQDLFIRGNFFM